MTNKKHEELRKIISRWCYKQDKESGFIDELDYSGEPDEYMDWVDILYYVENIIYVKEKDEYLKTIRRLENEVGRDDEKS